MTTLKNHWSKTMTNVAIVKYSDDLVRAEVVSEDTDTNNNVSNIFREMLLQDETQFRFCKETNSIDKVTIDEEVDAFVQSFNQVDFPCIEFNGSFSEFDKAESYLDLANRVRKIHGWTWDVKALINHKKILVIFGAPDPESEHAREILKRYHQVAIATATVLGKLVHAGNAYKADSYTIDTSSTEVSEFDIIIRFECSVMGMEKIGMLCDHHNPGDPGWEMSANQYWQASALGQLCHILGHHPDRTDRMIAAGDHCPAAAYAGQCKGIDPINFTQMRLDQKIRFYVSNPKLAYKADPAILASIIDTATEKLAHAPIVKMDDIEIRDMRIFGEVDELPEAALKAGYAYLASLPEIDRDRNPTGNTKIVLGGHTASETVKAFMNWAATLTDRVGEPYGNPDRGYAGIVVRG